MPRTPQLPSVQAYHAKIIVNKGDKMYAACVSRPDWCYDHEVVADLARETGSSTVGEALLKAGVDIEEVEDPISIAAANTDQDKHVFEWEDQV